MALQSWPTLPRRLLALPLLFPTTHAATESMIYPKPNPEAFRSLALSISLIGALSRPPHRTLVPPSRSFPSDVPPGIAVLSFCVARRTAGFHAGGQSLQRSAK
jgi:hypothetical protein